VSWRDGTIWLLCVGTPLVLIYDCVAMWRGGAAATISDVVTKSSFKHPFVAFAVGVLCGHLFAAQVVCP
jgi:hypothetical protein